jgi:hypothetical protein
MDGPVDRVAVADLGHDEAGPPGQRKGKPDPQRLFVAFHAVNPAHKGQGHVTDDMRWVVFAGDGHGHCASRLSGGLA